MKYYVVADTKSEAWSRWLARLSTRDLKTAREIADERGHRVWRVVDTTTIEEVTE